MSSYNRPIIASYPNGAKLVSLACNFFTSTVGFCVGHRNDPPYFRGATHLLEHMLVAGASEDSIERAVATGRSRPPTERELIRLMNRYLGGTNGDEMNVYTQNAQVAFGHGDMMDRHAINRLFYAFATSVREGMYDMRRMSKHWLLDKETFDIERGAVDIETRIGNEDSTQHAMRMAMRLIYGADSPMGSWGDPSTASLEQLKLARLKQWGMYEFVPRKLRAIVIGPNHLKAGRMFRKAELDQIPDWEAAPLNIPLVQQVPELTGVMYHEIPWPQKSDEEKPITVVYMAWPTRTFLSSDIYVLQVLADIVRGRLEHETRDKIRIFPGGTYHPSVSWDGTSTHGVFEMTFETTEDAAHVEELTERALKIIEDIKTDTSTTMREDVADRRGYYLQSYQNAYRYNALALSDMILEYLANGDDELKRFMSYEHDMGEVSPQKVRNAANRYFRHMDHRAHVVVRPV